MFTLYFHTVLPPTQVEALTYDITGHVDMWMSFANSSTLIMGMYSKYQACVGIMCSKH